MKKLFTIITCLLFLSNITNAQSEDYKSNISLGAGATLMGVYKTAVEGIFLLDPSDNVTVSSVPNIEIGYDYGLTKWFSIGILGAYQNFSIKENVTGGENKYTISRMVVTTSLLFHYANAGKMDLYSGLRVGLQNWGFKATLDDATSNSTTGLENLSVFAGGASFQATLFGIRGYISDNIGIGGEIAIGAPHFASFSINYRL